MAWLQPSVSRFIAQPGIQPDRGRHCLRGVQIAQQAMGFLQMLKGALLSMVEHLLWFVVSPFLSLYLWCDLLVVSWWYFGCLCRKFTGEK